MQLVSKSLHEGSGFLNLNDFSQFITQPFCEVVGDELPLVNKDFMLVFIKKQDYHLVMLQSFFPGTNFYINALGEYLGEYLPSIYRQAPFCAIDINGELKVGVDETSKLFMQECKNQGKPMFEDGKVSNALNDKIQLLDARYKAVLEQNTIIKRLEELELFKPLKLSFLEANGKPREVNGTFEIDANKLTSLDASVIKELLLSGGLELFYHHKTSLQNKSKLQEFYYKQNDLKDKEVCYSTLYGA